jgi:hypothetical protein
MPIAEFYANWLKMLSRDLSCQNMMSGMWNKFVVSSICGFFSIPYSQNQRSISLMVDRYHNGLKRMAEIVRKYWELTETIQESS